MTDLTEKQPTAVLVRRYVAHVIDLLVHVASVAVPFLLLGEKLAESSPDTSPYVDAFRLRPDYAVRIDDQVWTFTRDDLIIIALVAAGIGLLITVVIQGRLGWTVGKLLTGLRTVNGDGGRPGIFRALFRTILLPIDALPSWLVPLVGGLIALFTTTNRRLGDLVAGTYVVRRSAWGSDPTGADGLDTTGWEAVGDEPSPVATLAEGEALRVGDAADPAATQTFTAPAQGPTAEAGSGKAPAYQPQWDPTRQAYLQWHPGQRQWLQFDEASGEWRPIG